MASIWHLLEGPGFFLLFSIHQVFILIELHPPLGEKKMWVADPGWFLLQSNKTNRLSYSTKTFNMELWTYDDFLTKKKHILFPTTLTFSQSHLACMSVHFRTKMQHTFFLTEQIPQAEKIKIQILETVNFHGEIWIALRKFLQKKLRVDERSAKTMIALGMHRFFPKRRHLERMTQNPRGFLHASWRRVSNIAFSTNMDTIILC